MSEFVRPADWLRQLFTPSRTEWITPNRVAGEVSLVQPYDGGGFPLYDPAQWGASVTSIVGASGLTTVLTVPTNRICRILAASVILAAAAAPSTYWSVQSPGTNVAVGISQVETGALTTFHLAARLNTPILGPNSVLHGRWFGGDVTTQVTWNCYYVFAPIGSVFYV